MSRATFGPKVLLTFLIWMIDIVCYLFICCLRVAAAWQLLLLLLGMAAALAWLPGLAWLLLGLAAAWLLWLGMAAAWLGCCLAALAWHGCCLAWLLCRLRGAQLTNIQKYCKNHRKTCGCWLLLPARAGRLCPPEPSRFARQACACRKTSQPQSALLTAPFRGTRPSRCCGRWLRCFGFLRKPR